MKTYNHKQFGKCEVVKEYADVIVIKTPEGYLYKISPTGIVPLPVSTLMSR